MKASLGLGILLYDLKYPIAYVHLWYESYQKVMRWIGGVAAGILTFSTSLLIGDVLKGTYAGQVDPLTFDILRWAFLLLGSCLLLVLLNLLVTYNWFVMVIKSSFEPLRRKPSTKQLLNAELDSELKSYGTFLPARVWGHISYFLGGLAGAFLFGGIVVYVIGALRIISRLFH